MELLKKLIIIVRINICKKAILISFDIRITKLLSVLFITQFIAFSTFAQEMENYLTTDSIYTIKIVIPCKIISIGAKEITFIKELDPSNYNNISLNKVIKYVKKNETPIYPAKNNSQDFSISDNYYSPFHQKIIDSTKKTVSEIGNYLSLGVGIGSNFHGGAAGLFGNYSTAYKSHLISISIGNIIGGEVQEDRSYFSSYYAGILFGESYRRKNLLFSLSAGVAKSDVFCYVAKPNSIGPSYYTITDYSRNGLSFPLEIKIYGLFYNFVGFGITSTYDISSENSAHYINFSIVIGIWNSFNKPKTNN